MCCASNQSSQQAVQPAYRAACPSHDRTASHDSSCVDRSGKSDGRSVEATVSKRAGIEANITPAQPLRWGMQSARSSHGPKQLSARRHAWGCSLLCHDASIPYSNKGFARLPKPTKATTLRSDLQAVSGKVCQQRGAAQAEDVVSAPRANIFSALPPCSSDQSPAVPTSGPVAAARVAEAPNSQPTDHPHDAISKHSLCQHQTGLATATDMQPAAQAKELIDAAKQGFWQELQGVLSQLPDPPGISGHSIVQAAHAQGAAAAPAIAQVTG